jgi:hypothetical protein
MAPEIRIRHILWMNELAYRNIFPASMYSTEPYFTLLGFIIYEVIRSIKIIINRKGGQKILTDFSEQFDMMRSYGHNALGKRKMSSLEPGRDLLSWIGEKGGEHSFMLRVNHQCLNWIPTNIIQLSR